MTKTYEPHPFAEIFPLHAGKPVWDLADDIAANGLLEPIIIYKGKILDGRRRQAACQKKNVKPKYERFKGTEAQALAFVVSKNLHRRHLGEAERAMVAAKIAKIPQGGKKNGNGGENSDRPDGLSDNGAAETPKEPVVTQAEAAELLNVSERQVKRAKAVIEGGTEELQQAVLEGEVTVSDAASVAKEEPEVQNEAVTDVKEGNTSSAKESVKRRKSGNKNGEQKFNDEAMMALYGKLIRAIDNRAKVHGKTGGYHSRAMKAMEDLEAALRQWQAKTAG